MNETRTYKVELGSDNDAEQASCVVCMPYDAEAFASLPDNVLTECAACGQKIFHSSGAPVKPPKMCFPCAMAEAGGHEQVDVITTPGQLAGLAALLGTKPGTVQ